jgi:hypothetical protein
MDGRCLELYLIELEYVSGVGCTLDVAQQKGVLLLDLAVAQDALRLSQLHLVLLQVLHRHLSTQYLQVQHTH